MSPAIELKGFSPLQAAVPDTRDVTPQWVYRKLRLLRAHHLALWAFKNPLNFINFIVKTVQIHKQQFEIVIPIGETMKYDDAEIYFLNFENNDLPNEAGATHIGMFMAWLIMHNLVSEELQEEAAEEIEKVKSREITGRDFIVDVCDCKLFDEELNEEGNEFATWYYETNYIEDYCKVFEITGGTTVELCSIEDRWENYDKLDLLLDKRLNEWKKSHD